MAKRMLDSSDEISVLRKYDKVTAKEVFDAAKKGDELASQLVENHGKCLGKALATITLIA